MTSADKAAMNISHACWRVTNATRRARQLERKFLRRFKRNRGRLPKYNDRILSPP